MQTEIVPNSFGAWVHAMRPRTLILAVLPVCVGTILALPALTLWISISALLTALCIQAGTNLINDALDFKKGADSATRIGFKRASQSGLLSPQHVLYAGFLAFACALLFGTPLVIVGGWPIAMFLAASVFCGYIYTGGPFPLAYKGFSEVFVILFFGLGATVVVNYLQTKLVQPQAILAGMQLGCLACILLTINNLRDRVEDAKVNKRTLAVRFGKTFARLEVTFFALVPFALGMAWLHFDYFWAAILPLILLPFALNIVMKIWRTEPSEAYNALFCSSAFIILSFGALLSLGLYLVHV